MTVKWIKIVTELFEDEKIRLIESMPKGDSLLVLWFKLLCLAGKCNHSGVLLLDEQRPYDAAMLATLFRRPKKQVEQALALFAAFGMVEQASGVWFIPNWAKHQSVDAIAKKNQYMREYMKQYRAKQRQIAQVGQNIRADAAPDKPGQADGETNSKINSKANGKTNVSLPEEEKEKDKEKEKIIPPKSPQGDLQGELSKSSLSDDVKSALSEWLDYKRERKEKYTPTGWEKLLTITARQIENHRESDVIALIEESMANNWQGIAWDRLSKKKNQQTESRWQTL